MGLWTWLYNDNERLRIRVDLLERQVRMLKDINEVLRDVIETYTHGVLATELTLGSITINNSITIKGNIMSVALKPTDYVIGTLAPKGLDAQGNKVDAKLKAGSLITYSISDSSIGTITPSPSDPLVFKVAGVNPAGGTTGVTAVGVNENGDSVTFNDTFTFTPTPPPPPVLATSFDVTYTPPADQTASPAPF